MSFNILCLRACQLFFFLRPCTLWGGPTLACSLWLVACGLFFFLIGPLPWPRGRSRDVIVILSRVNITQSLDPRIQKLGWVRDLQFISGLRRGHLRNLYHSFSGLYPQFILCILGSSTLKPACFILIARATGLLAIN